MITTQRDLERVETYEARVPAEVRYQTWTHWPVNWTSIWVGTLTAFALVVVFGLIGIAIGAHVLGAETRVVDLKKWGLSAAAFSIAAAFFAFSTGVSAQALRVVARVGRGGAGGFVHDREEQPAGIYPQHEVLFARIVDPGVGREVGIAKLERFGIVDGDPQAGVERPAAQLLAQAWAVRPVGQADDRERFRRGHDKPGVLAQSVAPVGDEAHAVDVFNEPTDADGVPLRATRAGGGGLLHDNASLPLTIGAWIGDGGAYSTSTIDDVAIWNRVLSPTEIQALAQQTRTPVNVLLLPDCPTIERNGATTIVRWGSGALLEQATDINGPWELVANATSPHTAPVTGPTRFFRLRAQ